ncbi:hypothetical protein C0Q70_19977 [Pomacea canaliculata]|uniref:Uncharacterized protein n=1 Tax=Pomacea canaliculata TaxID=400727 RepID=A0A2T7NE85_POMCA|nr:hypothetical protein C0Q70_19977 [Pomacea canaliculata]
MGEDTLWPEANWGDTRGFALAALKYYRSHRFCRYLQRGEKGKEEKKVRVAKKGERSSRNGFRNVKKKKKFLAQAAHPLAPALPLLALIGMRGSDCVYFPRAAGTLQDVFADGSYLNDRESESVSEKGVKKRHPFPSIPMKDATFALYRTASHQIMDQRCRSARPRVAMPNAPDENCSTSSKPRTKTRSVLLMTTHA